MSAFQQLRTLASKALSATPLAYWPVTVRTGPAKGARWTFVPHSNNWRNGGEEDCAAGLAALGDARGAVGWDLGAHFGIHTVGMAMQVGSTGQVAAFEPDPVAFGRLRRHVEMNRLGHVRLFQAAASDRRDTLPLVNSHGLGSAYTHFQYEDEVLTPETTLLNVATVAIDDLVACGELRHPDLIKLDVQGHGAKALQGAIKSIERSLPIVLFSNHSQWELHGVRDLLDPLGYRAFSFSGDLIGWDGLYTQSALLRVPGKERQA